MKSKIKDNSVKKLAIIALSSVIATVLIFVGVFCYLFVDLEASREVIEIPDLVGKRFDNIGKFDKIKIESEPIFSSEVPEGEIVSQFPAAGAKRKLADGEKYTVKLTVSLGKELQTIPKLQDFKYSDAAAALRSIGARIKIVSIYDDKRERDVVLRTLPEAGERIERGQTVTLFVSRNHIHGSVCVKDLTGMAQSDAITDILAQGLTLGEIVNGNSEEYALGTVISQSISPGHYVLHGTKIDIVVNTVERVENHPFRKDIISKTEN